jgi:UDP-N-acetylmuramate dehydrogenase
VTAIRALAGALQKARVGEIRLEERLAGYTSFKVGGPCRALVRPPDLASLERLVGVLGELEVPFLPLGGGTNMLVADEGWDGVVIATDALQEWEESEDGLGLRVGAGVLTARVLKWSLRHDLTGFEGLTGVPGSIGGASVMNAGGRGGYIRESLVGVEVVTPPPECHVVEVAAEALGLAYRSSALPPGSIIGRVSLRLRPADPPGSARRKVAELLAHRAATQPSGVLSVGSVFKNPPGDASGRLIDACGLKGVRLGGAVVSEVHANYIINSGGATAADLHDLIDQVRAAVEEKTGIRLETEVVLVGFPQDPFPAPAWNPRGRRMAPADPESLARHSRRVR